MMDSQAAGLPVGPASAMVAAMTPPGKGSATKPATAGGPLEFNDQLEASLAENGDEDEEGGSGIEAVQQPLPQPLSDLAPVDDPADLARSEASADVSIGAETTETTDSPAPVDQPALAGADAPAMPLPAPSIGAAETGVPSVTASVESDDQYSDANGSHPPSAPPTSDQRADHATRKTTHGLSDAVLRADDPRERGDMPQRAASLDGGATATTVAASSETWAGERGAISPPRDAPTTPSESEVRTAGTVTDIAADTFGDLAEDARDESSLDERTEASRSAIGERGERNEVVKTPGTGASEPQTVAQEPRISGAPGLGSIALSRLADFEATHATLTADEATEPAPDTADRIVQSLRLQFQRGGGEATVHIKPDHLGPLTISLRVENGTVSAHVNAENPLVAEWLQANEHSLRDALKSNGLHLERLVVHRDPEGQGRAHERDQSRRDQRRRVHERHSTFVITV